MAIIPTDIQSDPPTGGSGNLGQTAQGAQPASAGDVVPVTNDRHKKSV
jgi:hypothetical protein